MDLALVSLVLKICLLARKLAPPPGLKENNNAKLITLRFICELANPRRAGRNLAEMRAEVSAFTEKKMAASSVRIRTPNRKCAKRDGQTAGAKSTR